MKDHRVRLTALLVLVLAGLLLAGCGPGKSEISVETTDFAFTPNSWPIRAGSGVTLTITNNGTKEHEWVIVNLDEEITPPFDEDDQSKVFWEAEVPAGETRTFTFTAPEEMGDYRIICGLPAHLEQGMEGVLQVWIPH